MNTKSAFRLCGGISQFQAFMPLSFPHSLTNLDFFLLPNDIREYFMYFSGAEKRKSIEFCLPYNEVFTFSPVLFCNRRNVSEILDIFSLSFSLVQHENTHNNFFFRVEINF
jgi:hypothetical protein